ncbi:Riboflavin transporter [Wickerhamomyces ciferrii]|uniref:Riboflavin transporter n=1 Tax=Wickerhamomyces ciferrii (strain ATCC 14091 / BCRC 22168 / CBS 111 / JCM 3599 / NBRC 0793 / NRRL Y-1031 F-60-10) TaxID=1206466 RepID=K0KM55_WICCF|nr:Riboflavin transporter [Wickerhamomyces ciferrii]CCH44081.1 Riboflavin transporter [Wickerhamomyces ciferrii]
MTQNDITSTQSPLETSKTVFDTRNDYFEPMDGSIDRSNVGSSNDRNNSIIVGNDDLISRIQSRKSRKHSDTNEQDIELQSVSSNETVRNQAQTTDDDGYNDSKEAMFANDDIDYPEGGLKAYLVVFGAFMGLTPCFGILNTTGAIETYISENQLKDIPSSTTSWIFSVFVFVNFTSCIFSGTYFDRNGARIPLIVGTLLCCGGLFASANCKTVWQFILAFGVLCGFGNGITLSPLVSVVPHYFNKRRGFFISIATTGGSVGGIIFPIMLRKLFDSVGFAWGMRVYGFVCLGCHAFGIAFARERLPHQKSDRTKLQNVLSYASAFDFRAFKEWRYIFVVLGCTFAEISVTTTNTYFTSYARSQGTSLSTAYLLTTLVNVGGIPGRWITGFYSDKIGRFNVMISTLIFTCAVQLIILIPFGHHEGALYAFSIIWGFSTGSIFPLLSVCCGQVSRTEDFGKRYSTMYFIVAFGTMASVPIGGAIIGDRSVTSFNYFMLFTALCALAGASFYAIGKFICVGFGLRKKF